MVWTEIPVDGHIYLYMFPRGGTMTARHRSDILEPIVRPHTGAIGDAFILMQYNALDGYPASLGFPIMHRAHATCTHAIIAIT